MIYMRYFGMHKNRKSFSLTKALYIVILFLFIHQETQMNHTTVPANMQALVDEKIDGVLGLMAAFMNARSTLGDKIVASFIAKVPEKGEALWLRFRTFQKEKTNWDFEPHFNHFIASVVMPNPFPTNA